jgi:hypothetical protein
VTLKNRTREKVASGSKRHLTSGVVVDGGQALHILDNGVDLEQVEEMVVHLSSEPQLSFDPQRASTLYSRMYEQAATGVTLERQDSVVSALAVCAREGWASIQLSAGSFLCRCR